MPVDALRPADSPRLNGEDPDHVNSLADAETALTPIIVHSTTYRVIDGMHRLRAAKLRGQRVIDVRLYDGTEADAFVLAVAANVTHGKPLSRADRTAAARRIISTYPDWSDRRIAAVSGLSRRTVGQLRVVTGHHTTPVRVGRDGRTRPTDPNATRAQVRRLLCERPHASLREIARIAGVSPSTVLDVRRRLQDNDPRARSDPALFGAGQPTDNAADVVQPQAADAVLHALANDPTLRLNVMGRALLRQLTVHVHGREQWRGTALAVPPHCRRRVAAIARDIAAMWCEFADRLTQADMRDRG